MFRIDYFISCVGLNNYLFILVVIVVNKIIEWFFNDFVNKIYIKEIIKFIIEIENGGVVKRKIM